MSKYNLTKTFVGKIMAIYLACFFIFAAQPVFAIHSFPIDYTLVKKESRQMITAQDRQKFKEILLSRGGATKDEAEKASRGASDEQIRKILDNPELVEKTGFIFIILACIGLIFFFGWLGSKVGEKISANSKSKNDK